MPLTRTIRLFLVAHLAVGTCTAIGISLGQCDDEVFKCQCGPKPGPTVDVTVPSCTFFYKWKPYCHACKNGQKVSPSDVCPKYQRCLVCSHDGESCSVCPSGKFGTFCDKSQTNGGKAPSLLDLNLSLGVLGGGKRPDDTPAPKPPVTDCRCLNGGRCQGFDDFCTCPSGFRGTYCEISTGCPPIPATPPASVVRIPQERPQYMEYSCPRTGYLLEGSPRLTCNELTGQWSHPPPTCVPACSVLRSPNNGWMVNVSLDTTLVKAGQSVEFRCLDGLVLIGPSRTTCMADTTWSHEAPFCSKVTFCREPESVVQATYQLQVPPFQPPFSNGTKVVFTCTDGHLLMGQSQIVCRDDGQWSTPGPTCVKVYDREVKCDTSGTEVVDTIGTPVRIHCPPNCAGENGSVWGTVIYEEESSVCRAAVHSGRITDALGGSLFVVNNGPYNDFLASAMNGVSSGRKRILANSFRFHHDPDLEEQNRDDPDKGCPHGWTELSGHCVYVVAKRRAWDAAKGICTNMGSRLPSLNDPQFVREIVRITRPLPDVQSFWLLSKSNSSSSGSLPLWGQPEGEEQAFNLEVTSQLLDEEAMSLLDQRQRGLTVCSTVSQLSDDPLWNPKPCTSLASFVCDIDLSQFQVTCEDPGELENGFVQLQDPERGFRRGAVVNFKCKSLHVLQGEATSACLPDATWSNPLPRCQRIPACLSPPAAKFGSFQILDPPPQITNSRIAGRPGTRRSRIGANLPTILTTTTAPANSTTIAPSNSTTIAPSNSTTIAPSNSTTTAPSNSTTIAPSNSTTGATTLATTTAAPLNSTSDHDNVTTTAAPTTSTPAHVRMSRSVQDTVQAADRLPPGHFRVGSRASYTCESRYYELVGSQTRRCQADGMWSGRPVTCLPICGRSDSPRTPFITHGNSSEIGQWPWQVGVAHTLPNSDVNYLLCGGTLLNEGWVVTAAHCATDEKTGLPLEPQDLRLYLGKYHRDDRRDDDFVQIRKGSEVHIHPDYDPSLYDADIALIRLESHVTLTSRVQPVCLPTDTTTRVNLVDGKKGVVIGWGLTESSEYAESLRHAVLPVVSHERCEQGYQEAGMPLSVTENMYCAGLEEGNTDACSGDSGGPMVFQMDTGSRKYWVLEGVVSWGSLTGCGNPRQYGGFTKVNQFLDWINQYI